MALPREPRQKMINIMYLVLTAILALNVSNEVINAFKVVDKSLINTNNNITSSNNELYSSLEKALTEPQSVERAKIWEPRAIQAKQLTDNINTYIDSLKGALKTAAGLKMRYRKSTGDSVEEFREDNLDASTRLFETGGEGPRLKARLDQYKEDMLAIDPSIKAKFETTFPVNTIPPISQDGTKKDFTQSFFHMTPTVAGLTMLSKFQNNIKNAESEIVTYCQTKIGAVERHMDKTGVLVGQSSNYLMPGQELTVTAGVGAYSSSGSPTISINGVNQTVVDGKAIYKTTASGAGERPINITVSFRDENNVLVTKSEVIKYVVGTPGGAAVMLDKMNVFYIGVPNPVTISSGTGWDKTHVSMTSGSLAPAGGGPGKYIVNVKEIGKTTINVNADGKNNSYEFRIKRIPDPILKVGPSSGGRIQSVVFKNQTFCRADLENFDFDARFSVVSATIYFSGANFPSVQIANVTGGSLAGVTQLSKCIPGTSVTFDNVKVKGPDEVVRPIPGPGFILY